MPNFLSRTGKTIGIKVLPIEKPYFCPVIIPSVLDNSVTPASFPADTINVVIPLFNDWEALGMLLNRISSVVAEPVRSRLAFLIVDDCSAINLTELPADVGHSLSVLRLYRNVGHQKAIALGLSYLADQPQRFPDRKSVV